MIVMASGGFDPLHEGHLDLLNAAMQHGTLIVALNSDDWLYRKKEYVFQRWGVRARILKALRWVTDVTPVTDSDGTVCEALRRIRPDVFVNGGDRTKADPREASVCDALGIKQLFGIGGAKVASSSGLVQSVRKVPL